LHCGEGENSGDLFSIQMFFGFIAYIKINSLKKNIICMRIHAGNGRKSKETRCEFLYGPANEGDE